MMTTLAMMTKKKMIMTMSDLKKPISFVFGDSLPQSSAFDNDDNNDKDDNNNCNDYKADYND